MANVFKSSGANIVSASNTTIYTTPAATTTTVIGLSLANTYTASVYVTVKVAKSGGSTFNLVYQAPIPQGASLVAVGGDEKIVLQTGDVISAQVSSPSGGTVDALLSYLELT